MGFPFSFYYFDMKGILPSGALIQENKAGLPKTRKKRGNASL